MGEGSSPVWWRPRFRLYHRAWDRWSVLTVPGDRREVELNHPVTVAQARATFQPRPGNIGLFNGLGICAARPLGESAWVPVEEWPPRKKPGPRSSNPGAGLPSSPHPSGGES